MPAHDFLLEIGCEEIPSRFIAGAVEQLKEGAAALLQEQRPVSAISKPGVRRGGSHFW